MGKFKAMMAVAAMALGWGCAAHAAAAPDSAAYTMALDSVAVDYGVDSTGLQAIDSIVPVKGGMGLPLDSADEDADTTAAPAKQLKGSDVDAALDKLDAASKKIVKLFKQMAKGDAKATSDYKALIADFVKFGGEVGDMDSQESLTRAQRKRLEAIMNRIRTDLPLPF